MKKILYGLLIGALAGILDVIPMLLQKLPWEADLSAFMLWLAVGVLVMVTDIKINKVLKGVLVAFLVLLSPAVIIAAQEPFSLLPVAVMTLLLGSIVGYLAGFTST
ncbi:MAG: hypothetical protein WCT39_01920 [Candidatus Margulisiibacteriota bacterium]|jgi:hypothetical protein